MKPISVTSSEALSHKTFSLISYPAPNPPAIEITGIATRQEDHLSIHYDVRGDVEIIHFPAFATPARKDDLWKATCFEFFLTIPDLPEYWEFNMSPSSEWNVYRMDAYRRIGFREETAISQLPFDFRKDNNGYTFDVSVDMSPIIQSEQNIQIGITAIIQTKDGDETYWALVHPGKQADFHLRESFILEIQ